MRSILIVRNSPTPTETVTIRTVVSISGTFLASTCKSGSAMVMITPSTKLRIRITPSFFERVICAPMWVPICVMDRSDPTVNSPMPRMIMTDPIKNDSIRPLLTGIRNRHSAATISVIGSTEAMDSRIFSIITFLFGNCILLHSWKIFYKISILYIRPDSKLKIVNIFLFCGKWLFFADEALKNAKPLSRAGGRRGCENFLSTPAY